ncbi:MAG: NAD(P)-dependent oxidoreductase [Naasia sp.]|jgi:UDP-glucose 4-epimerase|uniref:NAD-dependent epimerase/dehydratase family protein n=1 Tax=Naasia sp. TaxID=2546198 RepID=UPI00260D1A7E|nr:NAD(P)-dependent oxidoreductase [Naasia sp.]MCU1570922.1 NAD(P)-dependent oxidoreductase [Naasia sp.]
MRVLITGSRGQVGRVTVDAFRAAGHSVIATDRLPPGFDRDTEPAGVEYRQAELTDAGDCYALVARGVDAVVHIAAIPSPTGNTPATVFRNNLLATFNLIEAAVRFGVPRFVNISSETVPGFFFAERDFLPSYAPVDEEHPIAPQDPYALAKHFGEQLMDAAVARSDIRAISLRPSWVQTPGNYAENLGPQVRDAAVLSPNLWSYIDAFDLADAILLAAESDLTGHEVMYIASPDNVGGRDFAQILREHYGDAIELRDLDRTDASGISSAKAQRLLGWTPRRSWRDYLDEDGRAKPSS